MKVVGQGTGAAFPRLPPLPATCAGCWACGRSAARPPSANGYYAISAERRLKHPGVLAITNAARADVFAGA